MLCFSKFTRTVFHPVKYYTIQETTAFKKTNTVAYYKHPFTTHVICNTHLMLMYYFSCCCLLVGKGSNLSTLLPFFLGLLRSYLYFDRESWFCPRFSNLCDFAPILWKRTESLLLLQINNHFQITHQAKMVDYQHVWPLCIILWHERDSYAPPYGPAAHLLENGVVASRWQRV